MSSFSSVSLLDSSSSRITAYSAFTWEIIFWTSSACCRRFLINSSRDFLNYKLLKLKYENLIKLYFAFSTSSEYLSDLKTIQINRKISLLLARSKLFNSKEKQRTAKVSLRKKPNYNCSTQNNYILCCLFLDVIFSFFGVILFFIFIN